MKTRNFVILLLCAAMVSVTATAQRRMRTINPADTLRSIVSNADGSVSFRIYAPQAQAVSLAGDFSGLNAVFTKGDDGIWTALCPKSQH